MNDEQRIPGKQRLNMNTIEAIDRDDVGLQISEKHQKQQHTGLTLVVAEFTTVRHPLETSSRR